MQWILRQVVYNTLPQFYPIIYETRRKSIEFIYTTCSEIKHSHKHIFSVMNTKYAYLKYYRLMWGQWILYSYKILQNIKTITVLCIFKLKMKHNKRSYKYYEGRIWFPLFSNNLYAVVQILSNFSVQRNEKERKWTIFILNIHGYYIYY